MSRLRTWLNSDPQGVTHSSTGLLLLAAVLVAPLGCSKPPTASRESAPAAALASASGSANAAGSAIPSVRFGKVESRKLARVLEMTGTLDADERSEVAAQTPGAVVKVHVDAGTRVKQGDVLVELDGRDAELRLASANAQAARELARLGIKSGERFDPSHMADVRVAKESLSLAQSEAARAQTLFESGGVTKASLDQARSAAERAKAQLDMAENGAAQAWASLLAAQAQARLSQKSADDTRIRAPFNGAVVEKRIAPGEYAQAGRVVVVLVRDNPLRLRIDVPEADLSGIAVGLPVEFSVAAFPGRVFHGEIRRVSASVKTQSRALPIEAEIKNDSGELRPGFFARARLSLAGDPTDAFVVPRSAVGTSGSAAHVFIRSGDRVVERLVTPGREIDGMVEVRGQLKAGDEIALTHVDELSDSAAITVVP